MKNKDTSNLEEKNKAIVERLAEINKNKYNEMDGNIIVDLHLAVADGVLSSMAEKKIAKGIWNTITKLYNDKSQ